MNCPAEWREDDGETAACELEYGHTGDHQWRNVIAPPARGWATPAGSTLAHYFVSGVSLCFRWSYAFELDARAAVTPDDCVACTRRLASHAPDGAQTMPGGAVLPSGALREPGGAR